MVNLAGYQGRSARPTAGAGQLSLLGEPQHAEPTRELIAEHERLVQVLQSPSHEDDKAEAKKQAVELEEMKKEIKPSDEIVRLKGILAKTPKHLPVAGLEVRRGKSDLIGGIGGDAWFAFGKDGQKRSPGFSSKAKAQEHIDGLMVDNPEWQAVLSKIIELATKQAGIA